uniref:G-protein coupled receptors family 1 profile domain-containing protein n=1 Tax=Pelusios castaneus TaxID=367368 RepID=A0A8C8S4H3_9SAUR
MNNNSTGGLPVAETCNERITSPTSNLGPQFTLVVLVLLAILMVLLALITVFGNGLVILAFLVNKNLRHRSNYFFLNLAISDFLVGAFCIPLYIPYILTGKWIFGRLLCKLWLVVDYLMCTASAFNIVLISYDRFVSVTKAVTYRIQQGITSNTIARMVSVWVFAFLLYAPAIIIWEHVAGCSIVPDGECYVEFYYTWYFLLCASVFEFFIPCISVAYFNMHIYWDIKKRKRNRLRSTVSISKRVSVPSKGNGQHQARSLSFINTDCLKLGQHKTFLKGHYKKVSMGRRRQPAPDRQHCTRQTALCQTNSTVSERQHCIRQTVTCGC